MDISSQPATAMPQLSETDKSAKVRKGNPYWAEKLAEAIVRRELAAAKKGKKKIRIEKDTKRVDPAIIEKVREKRRLKEETKAEKKAMVEKKEKPTKENENGSGQVPVVPTGRTARQLRRFERKEKVRAGRIAKRNARIKAKVKRSSEEGKDLMEVEAEGEPEEGGQPREGVE